MGNKRKIKTTNSNTLTGSSSLPNIVVLLVAAFLLIAPYAQGLFVSVVPNFEEKLNIFILFGSFLVFIGAIIVYQYHKDHQLHFIHYAIWLIPLGYLIPVFTAVSPHSALKAVLLNVVYAAFFVVGSYIEKNKGNWFIAVFLISGASIVFFGFAHWFGLKYYNHAVLQGRFSSVFQYANTYAIFALAVSLCCIYLLVMHRHRWYIALPIAFLVVPAQLSFFLSSSRGALIAFPLILLIIGLFLSFSRQIVFGTYLLVGLFFTLIIYSEIRSIGLELQDTFLPEKSLGGWSLLIFASLGLVGFVYLFQKFAVDYLIRKINFLDQFQFCRFLIPLIVLIVMILTSIMILYFPDRLTWLPSAIRERVGDQVHLCV